MRAGEYQRLHVPSRRREYMTGQPDSSVPYRLAYLSFSSQWTCLKLHGCVGWRCSQQSTPPPQIYPISKRQQQTAATQTAALCSNWPFLACSEAYTGGVPDACRLGRWEAVPLPLIEALCCLSSCFASSFSALPSNSRNAPTAQQQILPGPP